MITWGEQLAIKACIHMAVPDCRPLVYGSCLPDHLSVHFCVITCSIAYCMSFCFHSVNGILCPGSGTVAAF